MKKSLLQIGIINRYDDSTTWDWCVVYRFYGATPVNEPQPTMEAAWDRAQEIYNEYQITIDKEQA